MSDLAIRPPGNALMNLSLSETLELGKVLASSGYFATVTDTAKAVAKILMGREVGIGPMTALREIHVIEGRTSFSANLIAALIQNSGRFAYRALIHSEAECRIAFYEGDQLLGETSVTFAQMSRVTNKDGKRLVDGLNWKNYPAAMLFARAISSGARTHCPGVFVGGAVYTPDELAPDSVTMTDDGDIVEGTATETFTYEPPPPPMTDAQKYILHAWIRGKTGPQRDALFAAHSFPGMREATEAQAAALITALHPPAPVTVPAPAVEDDTI